MTDRLTKAQAEAQRISKIELQYLFTIEEAAKDVGVVSLRNHLKNAEANGFPEAVAYKGRVRLWDIREVRHWYSNLAGPGRPKKN